jgi:hypothetical protein
MPKNPVLNSRWEIAIQIWPNVIIPIANFRPSTIESRFAATSAVTIDVSRTVMMSLSLTPSGLMN